MDIVIWIFTLIVTFIVTEFTAWFNHKYIMHGPLWILHKDHHKKDHKSWFERNDLFFFFYAFLSASFVVLVGTRLLARTSNCYRHRTLWSSIFYCS